MLNGSNNSSNSISVEQKDVFGHRCEIFEGCLLTVPVAVHFDKDGTGHNAVGQIEQKHQTDPKLIASNKEVLDKDGSFKAMVDESSTNMFKVVKWWSRNQQNCCSIATKIPHSNIDKHIKPYEEHIEIANPKTQAMNYISILQREAYPGNPNIE